MRARTKSHAAIQTSVGSAMRKSSALWDLVLWWQSSIESSVPSPPPIQHEAALRHAADTAARQAADVLVVGNDAGGKQIDEDKPGKRQKPQPRADRLQHFHIHSFMMQGDVRMQS